MDFPLKNKSLECVNNLGVSHHHVNIGLCILSFSDTLIVGQLSKHDSLVCCNDQVVSPQLNNQLRLSGQYIILKQDILPPLLFF